jgi:hypothetical protein
MPVTEVDHPDVDADLFRCCRSPWRDFCAPSCFLEETNLRHPEVILTPGLEAAAGVAPERPSRRVMRR